MKIIKAPEPLHIENKAVFLAGSIEQGRAEKWQDRLSRQWAGKNITILNPRRDDWDNTWKEDIQNQNFFEQVSWELDALDRADHIVFYFSPGTKSPISLLELGLYAKTGKLIVCCPKGFWKKGNVDIVCHRHGVTQVDSLQELLNYNL